MEEKYEKLIRKFVKTLSKYKKIDAAYLFGSYLNNFGNLSDIDICIIGDLKDEAKREILREAPELFDVSFFYELPIFIKARVFGEGKEIYLRRGKSLENLKYFILREYRDFMLFMKNRIMSVFENV